MQLLELGDPVWRKEVDAGGEHLTELDEGRTELLEREAHALRRLEPLAFDRSTPVEQLSGALQDVCDADPADDIAETVADQDRGDLMQAWQIPHDAQGGAEHQVSCSLFGGSSRSVFCVRSASASPESTPLGEVCKAGAELARHLQPGDSRIERRHGKPLCEIAHHRCHLAPGLGARAPCRRQRLAELGLDPLARSVRDLADGGEEIVFQLAQIGDCLFELVIGEITAGGGELLERDLPGLGGSAQRLVQAREGFGHRLAHVHAVAVRTERDTLRDRAYHVLDAVAVEVPVLECMQGEIAHPLANVLARATVSLAASVSSTSGGGCGVCSAMVTPPLRMGTVAYR